jgi:hypothetical protein
VVAGENATFSMLFGFRTRLLKREDQGAKFSDFWMARMG